MQEIVNGILAMVIVYALAALWQNWRIAQFAKNLADQVYAQTLVDIRNDRPWAWRWEGVARFQAQWTRMVLQPWREPESFLEDQAFLDPDQVEERGEGEP